MATLNDQSSFTADAVARLRAYTDIPLSKEIIDAALSLEKDRGQKLEADKLPPIEMAPYFEARYLLTDREIAKSGCRQILELASGLSPRGMVMAKDEGVNYAELDLSA